MFIVYQANKANDLQKTSLTSQTFWLKYCAKQTFLR